jgi:hypothetical protein
MRMSSWVSMFLQVEEADAQVQELEAEQERLHRANVDLSDRNSILEKYLQLKDSPEVSCWTSGQACAVLGAERRL